MVAETDLQGLALFEDRKHLELAPAVCGPPKMNDQLRQGFIKWNIEPITTAL
ncbi:2770_t:CDS:2, partial [Dentiscutata heterogama]